VTDVPPLGPYRTFQVPIEDIASATALELAELVAADRYAPIASAAGAEDRWTELAEFDAIVL